MNFFNIKTPIEGEETVKELLQHKNVTINRIVSNSLNDSAWYEQDEDEWLLLVEGAALLLIEDEEKTLKAGDTLFIPAHELHKVISTSENALWLTVHIG
ncbi:MAG: cupin domain-containing protein [Helicobacteraceae bacterium]|jgi:cupin 2 domain-containing protein|nr:cupin domain-containing protein [Helicobacteraceae bacterium]